jgi:hypothetical protein
MATVVTRTGPGNAAVAAWVSLALAVPCFFLAFGVGEGLISLLGYDVGGRTDAPAWAAVVATVPALLAFALPLWPTWHFGRIAARDGSRTGMVPFVIMAVLVAAFTIMNSIPMGQ